MDQDITPRLRSWLQETIASNIVLVAPKSRKLAWPARVFVDFMATINDQSKER
jgi:hypothetical protein